MAVSSPKSGVTSVYGIDQQVWRRFRAWCVERGLSTGEQVTAALEAFMESAKTSPSTPGDHQT